MNDPAAPIDERFVMRGTPRTFNGWRRACGAGLLLLMSATSVGAQEPTYRISERATLTQTVGKTKLSGDNVHAYADVDNGDDADPAEEIASSGGNWNCSIQPMN